MSGAFAHVLYALAWASFAVLHSLLLNDRVRDRLRGLTGRRTRLSYTVVSLVHVGLVLAAARALFGPPEPFALPQWAWFAFFAVFAAGVAEMVVGFRPYDTLRFLGLTPDDDAADPLIVTGLNRHVRHPLYGGGVLVLWGLAFNEAGVATAVWGSIYLVAGALVEERRLLRRYGKPYAEYCARTPRFIPRRRP